jgi:hypothetical protein
LARQAVHLAVSLRWKLAANHVSRARGGYSFTVRNYAYLDPYGRETVTWIRNFATHHPRRFDAYMIYSKERGCIVDYLGTHQHLAVDIHLSVDDRGGLRLRSGAQRFYASTKG